MNVLTAIVFVFLCAVTFYLLTSVAYGRSLAAGVAETYLKFDPSKRTLSDEIRTKKHLEDLKNTNEEFNFPLKKTKCAVTEKTLFGRKAVIFNDHIKSKTLLYIHGGGYIHEALKNHYAFCDDLAFKLSAKVVIPNYPLSPKHDHKAAYAYLKRVYGSLRKSSKNLTLAGDSAGGGLALGLLQTLLKDGERLPEKATLISPWVNLTGSDFGYGKYEKDDPLLSRRGLSVIAKAWAGDTEISHYTVSPLFGEFKGLCPILLFAGTRELFYPEIEVLYGFMKQADVDVTFIKGENLNHAYPLYPIPEGTRSVERVVRFLTETPKNKIKKRRYATRKG